ncbi:TSUP family transporter, partial [Burkholderia gladioli]
MTIALILGALVGAVLGLTGAGGGILAVPALVAGLGWTIQQATPVALIAVAGSAAIGALEAFRRRLVRYRAALLMAAAGVPATSLGVRAAQALPQRLLLALFAAVMLV